MTTPAKSPDTDATAILAGQLRSSLGKLNRRLREQGSFGDFTLSQSKVLLRLERDGPATVTALAEVEGMRPQSMSGIVSALKATGMIEGEADPTDGRQTVLSLTEKCRTTIAASRAAKQDWLFQALNAKLTAGEQQQIADSLILLDRLIAP